MNWFTVVGFETSADFTILIINSSTVLPNVSTEAIMYVHSSLFGFSKFNYENNNLQKTLYTFENKNSLLSTSSSSDEEIYYSLKFENKNLDDDLILNLNDDFKINGGIEK
ncbi:hypothetical protein [Spiroplasma taiwanense]|uniref:hypothetical protein n=1 Tax=Spiroplasma taiwanense TaxID=2145 RepID=UPI0011D1BADD|nr:hypothetical protein [Spiroplasma taiwanense]